MTNFFIISKNQKKLNILTHSLEKISAILIHLHGLHAHFQHIYPCVDDFYHRIKYLKVANILSYALEFNGHGKSDGDKGSVDDYNCLIDDVDRLIEYVACLHPDKPIFLIGESMGGGISIIYGIKHSEKIKGVILLAPMIGLSEKIKVSDFILKFMLYSSNYFPKWKLISKKNRNQVRFKEYNSSREKCQFEIRDNINLITGKQCYLISEFIKKNTNKFNLPLLIFHSKNDSITSFNSSVHFFNKCCSTNKEIVKLDDYNHCLLVPKEKIDIIPDGVIYKITNWINNLI